MPFNECIGEPDKKTLYGDLEKAKAVVRSWRSELSTPPAPRVTIQIMTRQKYGVDKAPVEFEREVAG